jgi:hypothetical protein
MLQLAQVKSHVAGKSGGTGLITIRLRPYPSYISVMKQPRRRTPKDTPSKLARRMSRRWRVVLLRNKGEILGQVEASDAKVAKAAAAVQFELDDIQRNRIIVQELA